MKSKNQNQLFFKMHEYVNKPDLDNSSIVFYSSYVQ